MTKNEIIREMERRLKALRETDDEQQIKALACSSILSAESEYEVRPRLDKNRFFMYRGYEFELTSCNGFIDKDQVREWLEHPYPIFDDRYVCWLMSDMLDGSSINLVPDAWLYGTDDLLEGTEVDKYILDCIDEYLKKKDLV